MRTLLSKRHDPIIQRTPELLAKKAEPSCMVDGVTAISNRASMEGDVRAFLVKRAPGYQAKEALLGAALTFGDPVTPRRTGAAAALAWTLGQAAPSALGAAGVGVPGNRVPLPLSSDSPGDGSLPVGLALQLLLTAARPAALALVRRSR